MDPRPNQEPQQQNSTTPQGGPPPSQEPGVGRGNISSSPVVEPQPTPQPYVPPTPEVQPPVSPASEYGAGPMQTPPASPQPKKSKMWLIIVLVVLVLAGAGVAAYFVFFRNNTTANQAATQSSSGANSSATDLSTVSKAAISLPGDMTGYKENVTGYDTIKDYSTSNGNCELMFGAATAAELPGADLNAIVAPQLEELRSAGATVTGPSAGTALIVKDSADGKVTYSLPTLVFDLSQGNKHVTAHYSAVILKGGDRVVVNRICKNASGQVDQSLMSNLDKMAQNIVITKQ